MKSRSLGAKIFSITMQPAHVGTVHWSLYYRVISMRRRPDGDTRTVNARPGQVAICMKLNVMLGSGLVTQKLGSINWPLLKSMLWERIRWLYITLEYRIKGAAEMPETVPWERVWKREKVVLGGGTYLSGHYIKCPPPPSIEIFYKKKKILKVHKPTSSCIVYGEPGWYNLSRLVENRMISFWYRLLTGKQSKLYCML